MPNSRSALPLSWPDGNAAIDHVVDVRRPVGAVTWAAKDSEMTDVRAAGFAGRGAALAMSGDTLFRLACVFKPIDAVYA